LGALGAHAQTQQPAPTFRSDINYVQIPVRVLDARGEFVRGLTQSDFHILEDGHAQTISAFSAIEIPSIETDAAAVPDAPLAVGDVVASNESIDVDGRVYVFLFDNQAMSADVALRTRHVVRGFIRDHLKANDIAAVTFTGIGRGQHFTRNRRLLDDAVNRLLGDPDPTDDAARRSMAAIADTARALGTIKGRRKALVLLSTSGICSLIETDATSSCGEDARYALRMAMQSDVSIYTIDPAGLNTSRRSQAEHANGGDGAYHDAANRAAARVAFGAARSEFRGPDSAARFLAEESGGFAVVNTNSLSAGFARVARENSSYYLLGYYSTNVRADGKRRRNEIRVTRDGVRAVYRESYLASTADLKVSTTKAAGATNPGSRTDISSVDDQLQELANNPLPVSAMSLKVAAAPFALGDRKSSVVVTVEIPAEALKREGAATGQRARVRLSIGFYDRNGLSVGGEDPTIDISSAPTDALRFVSRVVVPPGSYRLWVGAVQTPSGVRGSVMTDIEVPDFSRPRLALSGIAVSTEVSPIATREFSADSEITFSGEIYDRRKARGPVSATVTVRSHDGSVVHETPFAPTTTPFGHSARIPLKGLGAGTYLATIEAVSAVPKRVSAIRTIGFKVQ
jgi:VWFA-related protein